jgi:hypothetical protein
MQYRMDRKGHAAQAGHIRECSTSWTGNKMLKGRLERKGPAVQAVQVN